MLFDVGVLPSGTNATMTVEVAPSSFGAWAWIASVQSVAIDPEPSNDGGSIEITVLPPPMEIDLLTPTGGEAPTLVLTVPVVSGYDSVVEYTDLIPTDSGWTPLPDAPHNSGSITLPASEAARFYRVVFIER
jgi:hypothetical protein